MTHTPGPWRIDRETDDFEIAIVGRPEWKCTRFGIKGEWDVCKLDDDNADTNGNAQLIAAAPDLLAACQAAEDFIASVDGDAALQIYDQVRAAIIRATQGG